MLSRIVKLPTNRRVLPGTANVSGQTKNSTVDQQQITNFNELKTNWWIEDGIMKPLHSLNKIRVPFVRDGLINTGLVHKQFVNTPQPLKNLQLLEVGCGGGILTEPLARLGCTITGIDAASDLINLAKEHKKQDPRLTCIHYNFDTVENHALTHAGKYDGVVASEVIEHVNDKDVFLKSCVACLKPKGSIFLTTLNQTMLTWIFGIIVSENVLRIVPKGAHEWDKLMQPHRLQKLLEDNGCRTRVIHGMFYNFLTNNWSWISDTSVSYAIHAIKN
ncbi:hypothetical protein RN001_000170 [Aquatica leii]|uniref:Ubiquinone biosynthesis O-methyltransferase, mitochondrial n=1 Tax=Aquatica leii TaxID=1421715 RepID=A0AAN7PEK3_9COLE|nr:hypothetical protein RN001_000170 [Aquatica leii]